MTMIKIGDRLPAGVLREYVEEVSGVCAAGPADLDVSTVLQGKRVIIVGVPGAFTPTCSEKHLPGFVARYQDFFELGVNEIWCLSVNDAYVMRAWGRDQLVGGRIRMIADGSCDYTRKLGLDLDLSGRGMGCRSRRYAMVVEDGWVRALLLEEPGQFAVSSAESVLALLG
jgi:peroxiredoxin